MSSFFTLKLDTTAPDISVGIPSFLNKSTDLLVFINANENLMNYQNFYAIDSNGDRYDFTLDYYGDYFSGYINTHSFALGVATFYIAIKDVVGNETIVQKQSILQNGIEGSITITCEEQGYVHTICSLNGNIDVSNKKLNNIDVNCGIWGDITIISENLD